jgi:hypothetical protein
VQIDLAHALQHAHKEGISTQQLAGTTALDVPLAKTQVGFLDPHHLFRHQLDVVLARPPFQLEQPFVTAPQVVLVQDVLDRRCADIHPFQLQPRVGWARLSSSRRSTTSGGVVWG